METTPSTGRDNRVRTPDEIVQYLHQPRGFLDFATEVLVPYLPFSHAQEFLKPEVTQDSWPELPQPISPEKVLADMKGYMEFAWGKVQGHRGLSANRSVSKMKAWMWMLGDQDLCRLCDDEYSYPQYGAPILAAISRKYDCPIPDSLYLANMIQGEPCQPGCADGCGQ